MFYIAVIPQFTPAEANAVAMGAALAAVHAVLTLLWVGVLILGATLAGQWLRTAKGVALMDAITGTVLVGFGLRVALARP